MINLIQGLLFIIVQIALPPTPADARNSPSKSDGDASQAKVPADNSAPAQQASAPMLRWPTLSAPADFRLARIAVDRETALKLESELVLQWSPVIGARNYAVQFCDARRCSPPSRLPAIRGRFGEEETFRDLEIVSGTRYVAAGLNPRKQYWFRVIGIDARGQRGDGSLVLIGGQP